MSNPNWNKSFVVKPGEGWFSFAIICEIGRNRLWPNLEKFGLPSVLDGKLEEIVCGQTWRGLDYVWYNMPN